MGNDYWLTELELKKNIAIKQAWRQSHFFQFVDTAAAAEAAQEAALTISSQQGLHCPHEDLLAFLLSFFALLTIVWRWKLTN